MSKLTRLSDAEVQLIEMLRAGKPCGVMIMLKEAQGEWVVSTSAAPLDQSAAEVGIAFSFRDAWLQRAHVAGPSQRPGLAGN